MEDRQYTVFDDSCILQSACLLRLLKALCRQTGITEKSGFKMVIRQHAKMPGEFVFYPCKKWLNPNFLRYNRKNY